MADKNPKTITLKKPTMMDDPKYIENRVNRLLGDINFILQGSVEPPQMIELRERLLNYTGAVIAETIYMNTWQEYCRLISRIQRG